MVPIVERIERDERGPAALVLAPTRELAAQIVEHATPIARVRGLEVAAVYGGVGFDKQIRAARRAHVLVATPGRLEDLIERGAVSLSRVRILVLDEADRMLDMGFRPPVDRIVARCPAERQTLFFSATLEGETGRIATAYTQDPVRHEHVPPALDAPAVEHRFVARGARGQARALVAELRRRARPHARLRPHQARRRPAGQAAGARRRRGGRHARRQVPDASARRRWPASSPAASTCLVATDVAARGIHVDGISHVINFDAPEDREGYVHRVGRTGRAGRTGVGITFVMADQAGDVGKIAASLDLHHEYEHAGFARPAAHAAARPHATGGGSRRRRYGRGRY